MAKVIRIASPRNMEIVEVSDEALNPDQVRVDTSYSGISAGTELTYYRGTNPFMNVQWDPDLRIFRDGEPTKKYPLAWFGYEQTGTVTEVGAEVQHLSPGDWVYGSWGHRSSAVVAAAAPAVQKFPLGVDPICGVFGRIGAIAMNGILDAQINVGETVAIFGMGIVGQLLAQLATASGANVIAVDLLQPRLDVASSLGLLRTVGPEGDAAEIIKNMTDGKGADVVFEASGSIVALNQAIRATAYSSKVVALGFYQGGAASLHFDYEFHHNRIDLVCSQISGQNPALAHRWNLARLHSAFMDQVARGSVNVEPLISEIVPFDQVANLFARIDQHPAEIMQAVLDFRPS